MTHWHAQITYEGTIDQDAAETLAGRGEFTPVTVDGERSRTTISFGVQAGTIRQATDAAHKAARDLVAGLVDGTPVALRVLTDAELEAELLQPQIPPLVDSTGAREILGGLTQQRLSQIQHEHADFPDPVATFAGGRSGWVRAQIEAFNERWERKPGRPRTGTP